MTSDLLEVRKKWVTAHIRNRESVISAVCHKTNNQRQNHALCKEGHTETALSGKLIHGRTKQLFDEKREGELWIQNSIALIRKRTFHYPIATNVTAKPSA
jgi:hypothetical protein